MVVMPMVRSLVRSSLLGTLLAATAMTGVAAPLGFDATFGNAGKVFANVIRGPSDDSAAAVIVQPDGKTVVAGTCKPGVFYAYCIARYDSSGNPDLSFGQRGVVVTPLGPGDATARAVTLDGTKIVVAGSCGAGANTDFCLVRYLADGSLDPSFNGTGIAITAVGAGADDAWALAMDGTAILVAGECQGGGGTQFCLARYLANGTLDPAYGSGGKVFAGFVPFAGFNPNDGARALLLSGGKAFVGGGCMIYNVRNMCVARFNSNGALDTGFGANGVASSELGMPGTPGRSAANALTLSGSRILLAGACGNGLNLDFCMLRVSAVDGAIDYTLAGNGYVKVPIGSGDDVATGIALVGTVTVLSGYCDAGGLKRFCLTVLSEAGGVTGGFNNGVSLIDSFGATDNFAYGLAAGNGLITLAGTCGSGTARDFCVTRYLGDGPRDTSFNGAGLRIHDLGMSPGLDVLGSLVRQPDGKLLAAGYCFYSQSTLCIARFNTDGSLDTAFGDFGTLVPTLAPGDASNGHVALDSQNRIVLAGSCHDSTAICALRYGPGGTLDTSFGIQGRATIALAANVYANLVGVAVMPDDSIVAGANCYFNPPGTSDFCWFKLTAGGSLDTGFGNNGSRLMGAPYSSGAYGFAADTSGSLIAGGCGSNSNNNAQFCVARVTPTGQLDPAFGAGTGRVVHDMGSGVSYANAVALQNGKILLGGSCTVAGIDQFCVARLMSDGSLDTTFSADGKASVAVGPYPGAIRALLPDGSGLIAAGSCSAVANGADFDLCLARFMGDGSLDTTFNDTGSLVYSLGTYTSRAVALVRDGNRIVAGAECTVPAGGDFCLAAFALLSNDLPRAPTATTAAAGDAQVSVSFTPPSDPGASAITQYTATCGAQSATGPASPLTVANLANGVAVACTVTATNGSGTGPASDPPAIATPRKVATVALTTSGASTIPGVYFTITATVAGQAPTGSVDFLANGILLPSCTGYPMSGNVATCITNQIPVGSYSLTVHYSGDVANTAADSASVPLTVAAGAVNLTYQAAGSGHGTATSTPAGLSCSSVSCVAAFALGTQVTITVTIPPGSIFGNIAPCDSNPQPHVCVVAMNASRTVTAFFQIEQNPLTVSKSGAGAGSVASNPAGIDCGATCIANFDYGTLVTLTPTANAGSVFSGWGGVCSGSGACQVTVDQMKFVTANFDLQAPPKLAVSQSATPSAAKTGKDIVYAITVSNTSAGAVSAVALTDTLASGMQFIWASPGCVSAGATVTCSLGTLAAGASTMVKVVLRAPSPGSFPHDVTASGSAAGPNVTSSLPTSVTASASAALALRYRLYSPVTLEHHFTTDLNEYNVLGSYVGTWVQEGTVGKVLNNPGAFNGVAAVPYYRLYDSATRWHHWTTDANEFYTLIQYANWSGEGVDGYILPTPASGSMQLYRLTYPFLPGLHHWTVDPVEYNALITTFGWIGEGGSGFVIQ